MSVSKFSTVVKQCELAASFIVIASTSSSLLYIHSEINSITQLAYLMETLSYTLGYLIDFVTNLPTSLPVKNFENQFAFGKVRCKSIVTCFLSQSVYCKISCIVCTILTVITSLKAGMHTMHMKSASFQEGTNETREFSMNVNLQHWLGNGCRLCTNKLLDVLDSRYGITARSARYYLLLSHGWEHGRCEPWASLIEELWCDQRRLSRTTASTWGHHHLVNDQLTPVQREWPFRVGMWVKHAVNWTWHSRLAVPIKCLMVATERGRCDKGSHGLLRQRYNWCMSFIHSMKVWVHIISAHFNFPCKLGPKVDLHIIHKCVRDARFYGICINIVSDA